MVEKSQPWELQGEYFECCSCDSLCPCLLSVYSAKPTQGYCNTLMALHVNKGRYGESELDGLNVVLALHSPGVMAQGNWTVAAYVDERGDAAQRQALELIISGAVGGSPSMMRELIATQLPATAAPIEFQVRGRLRSVQVPGVTEATVEGVRGNGDVPWIQNVFHVASDRLAAAITKLGRYQDHGMQFDNAGKSGFYTPVQWQGG